MKRVGYVGTFLGDQIESVRIVSPDARGPNKSIFTVENGLAGKGVKRRGFNLSAPSGLTA